MIEPRYEIRFTLPQLRQMHRLAHGASEPLRSALPGFVVAIANAEAHQTPETGDWSIPRDEVSA